MTTPHPDPDDLVLAALPAEEPEPALAAHLAVCEQCRGEVEELRRTVELADEGAGHLRALDDAALTRIRSEVVRRTTGPAPLAAVATAPRPRRRWLVAAGALVAAAAVFGAGVLVGTSLTGSPPPTQVLAQLRPFGTVTTGGGTVTATDTRPGGLTLEIHLTGVPGSPDAGYLEVWLMDAGGGELVAIGGLTRHGDTYDGTFTVPADLPMDRLRLVDVSEEHFDGNPAHSGVSLYRGTMA
jgi:hypothetical protein